MKNLFQRLRPEDQEKADEHVEYYLERVYYWSDLEFGAALDVFFALREGPFNLTEFLDLFAWKR